jgi:hypothetical protein
MKVGLKLTLTGFVEQGCLSDHFGSVAETHGKNLSVCFGGFTLEPASLSLSNAALLSFQEHIRVEITREMSVVSLQSERTNVSTLGNLKPGYRP